MRLRKADVERLLRHLGDDDAAGLRADLEWALALCLSRPGAPFGELVHEAGVLGGWPPARVDALISADADALSDLATELAETRQVVPH